jgi:hypothetical protein
MSRADMRIYTDEELAHPSPIDAYADLVRITRPVTREDVLAAVQELGAVEVEWCVVHKRTFVDNPSALRCNLGTWQTCKPEPHVLVPRDVGDAG